MTRIIRGGVERRWRQATVGGTRIIRRSEVRASQKAQQILAEAEREVAESRSRVQVEGVQQLALAQADARARAAKITLEAERARRKLLGSAEEQLTELALQIAEKLLGAQLSLHPETIAAVVEKCLTEVAQSRRVTIRVNPDDLPYVESSLEELRHRVDVDLLLVDADPALERGGCLLETESGQIDGRLQTQLAAIREALMGRDPSER